MSQNSVWTGARATAAAARYSNVSKDLRQDHPFMALSHGDYHRQRTAAAVNGMVDLRRQSTA